MVPYQAHFTHWTVFILIFIAVATTLVHSAQLAPARTIPSHWFENYEKPQARSSEYAIEKEDQEVAASGHKHGRVQIKVFRGPTHEGEHEHFAPHGYWVKQPADDDRHH